MKKALKKGLKTATVVAKKEVPKTIDISAVQTIYLKRNKNWVTIDKTRVPTLNGFKVEAYVENAQTLFLSKI